MHQATSQRTPTVHACVSRIIVCMRVCVCVCERVSLSSVVHISVVRCTLFRCLRLVGKARRIPRYIVRLRGRIRFYNHREEPRAVGDWANVIHEHAEKKNINFEGRSFISPDITGFIYGNPSSLFILSLSDNWKQLSNSHDLKIICFSNP